MQRRDPHHDIHPHKIAWRTEISAGDGHDLPVAAGGSLLLGAIAALPWVAAAGIALLCLPLVQLVRLTMREWRRRPLHDALTIAVFLMLAKPAQALGAARYWLARTRGRRSTIIEYKGEPA